MFSKSKRDHFQTQGNIFQGKNVTIVKHKEIYILPNTGKCFQSQNMTIFKRKEMFSKSKCDHFQTQGNIFQGKNMTIVKRREIFSR